MWRYVLGVSCLLVVACGGSPTAPAVSSPPAPVPPAPTIPPAKIEVVLADRMEFPSLDPVNGWTFASKRVQPGEAFDWRGCCLTEANGRAAATVAVAFVWQTWGASPRL